MALHAQVLAYDLTLSNDSIMTRTFTHIALALAFIVALTSCREYEVTMLNRMQPGITIANASLSIIDETSSLVRYALNFNYVLEAEDETERYERYEQYFDHYKLERVDEYTYEFCSLIYSYGNKVGFRITTDGKRLSEGGYWLVASLQEEFEYSICGTSEGYDVELTNQNTYDNLTETATLKFKEYEGESIDVISLGITGHIHATEKDALTLDIELKEEVRFVSNMGYIAGVVEIECNNFRHGYIDEVIVTLREGDMHDIEYNGEYAMIPNSNAYYREEY